MAHLAIITRTAMNREIGLNTKLLNLKGNFHRGNCLRVRATFIKHLRNCLQLNFEVDKKNHPALKQFLNITRLLLSGRSLFEVYASVFALKKV